MLDFQRYQLAFTAHIRNPKLHAKPKNVVDARMAVYRESVFNNIFESISVCFPVCQNVLGKRKWRQLIRSFVSDYSADSPLFREIPQQFLAFLDGLTLGHHKNSDSNEIANQLPPYLKQLAHYEWIELAISSKQTDLTKPQVADLNCLDNLIALPNASELLAYDYPVHQISARFKPTNTEKTYLLVFRNSDFDVKFIVLNPVTFQLLSLIQSQHLVQSQPLTGRLALTKLAGELQHPDIDLFIQFGADILNALLHQQAITLKSPFSQ